MIIQPLPKNIFISSWLDFNLWEIAPFSCRNKMVGGWLVEYSWCWLSPTQIGSSPSHEPPTHLLRDEPLSTYFPVEWNFHERKWNGIINNYSSNNFWGFLDKKIHGIYLWENTNCSENTMLIKVFSKINFKTLLMYCNRARNYLGLF